MPNFALWRMTVSRKDMPAGYAASYSYAYEYPVRCLKLLGIGEITGDDEKPTVEGGYIFTNPDYGDAAPIRIVDDVEDVGRFSPDFVLNFVMELAKRVALATTQDKKKKADAQNDATIEEANTSALNAQENKPVRKSTSRFRAARYSTPSSNVTKR